MKTKNTVILLIVCIALGLFIWMKERHGDDYRKRASALEKIYDFDPSQVFELVVLSDNGAVVAKKEGLIWNIVEPLSAKGDQFEIESMIQTLNSLRFEREIDIKDITAETLDKDFHLKKPEYILSWTAARDRYSLRIGADTPMGNGLFVQKEEGGSVYIVSHFVRETLARDLSQLRDRAIFPFEEGQVSQVNIRSLSTTNPYQIQFSVTDNIKRITKPIDARANQETITNLIRFLVDARAMDFISEGAADLITYGLSEPDLEVTLLSSDPNTSKTLLIGNPVKNDPGKHYAKLKEGNSVFTITAELYHELTKPLNDFRDPLLIERFPHELNAIVIKSGNKELKLVGENNEWFINELNGEKADTEILLGLLSHLMNTPIVSYVSDAPESLKTYGLDPAPMSITLIAKPTTSERPEGESLRIDFSKPDKTGIHAKRSDELFVYKIPVEQNEFAVTSPDFYLDRTVTKIPAQDIRQIEILRPGQEAIIIERDPQNQKWRFHDETTQGVINLERLEILLGALQNFRAASAQPVPAPPKEMSHPPLTVAITAGDGQKYILKFGKHDKKNGRAMILEGQNVLYQVDESVYQLLDKELVTRVGN